LKVAKCGERNGGLLPQKEKGGDGREVEGYAGPMSNCFLHACTECAVCCLGLREVTAGAGYFVVNP